MNIYHKPKFRLGKMVITPGAIDILAKHGTTPEALLKKHQAGNWGNLCQEDSALNDEAVANEGDPEKQRRLLSSYKTGDDTIWIITEWDRSVTTLLLPSEY